MDVNDDPNAQASEALPEPIDADGLSAYRIADEINKFLSDKVYKAGDALLALQLVYAYYYLQKGKTFKMYMDSVKMISKTMVKWWENNDGPVD